MLTADSSVLKEHTDDHVLNTKEKNTLKIDTYLKPKNYIVENKLDASVKSAEILLGGFFAEHDVPFLAFDHIIPVLRKMFPDSAIAQKMWLVEQR